MLRSWGPRNSWRRTEDDEASKAGYTQEVSPTQKGLMGCFPWALSSDKFLPECLKTLSLARPSYKANVVRNRQVYHQTTKYKKRWKIVIETAETKVTHKPAMYKRIEQVDDKKRRPIVCEVSQLSTGETFINLKTFQREAPDENPTETSLPTREGFTLSLTDGLQDALPQ